MKKKIISLVSALILFNSVPAFAGTTDTTTNELLSMPRFNLHKVTVDYIFNDSSNNYKTIIIIDGTRPVFANELSEFLKFPTDIVDKINKRKVY
ncbi:hypothetical protein [Clostridium butyricum]|uniref:hypothetical protein n=1 Tax=Clostridium butyricum TaxID=1492 RepID=UPI00189DE2BE|nr:hypothetical protein [Clostridium butyricum]MDB2153248.1 hypothetical protein [Clostridium butyricum]